MVVDNLFSDPGQNRSEPPCDPLCLHAVSTHSRDKQAMGRPVHRCNGKQVPANSQTRDKCMAEPEQVQVRPCIIAVQDRSSPC